MSSSLNEEILELINELNLKTILVETKDKQGVLPSVTIDNVKGSYDSTKFLIEKGIKNIAFIGVEKDNLNAWGDRYVGYENAMKESGIEIDSELVYLNSIKVKDGYEGIQRFLKQNKKFEGVVCASDDIAMGAINALRDNGLDIPKDVSVIGFNDNFVASIFYPKITTISQPTYDMGSVAMRMLIKILNKKELEEPHYVLEHQLIERESTI